MTGSTYREQSCSKKSCHMQDALYVIVYDSARVHVRQDVRNKVDDANDLHHCESVCRTPKQNPVHHSIVHIVHRIEQSSEQDSGCIC